MGSGWRAGELSAMVATQTHRGPDQSGIYLDPSGQAGLGHNRLSIIDLSEGGRQPMANRDGSLHVAFNGEIYNYLELKAELGGYPFRTHSDTEVILAAYEKWGEGCLDRFIGMFAILLWDSRRQRLFAARDRFGVKPLHYHRRADGCLLLASEIRERDPSRLQAWKEAPETVMMPGPGGESLRTVADRAWPAFNRACEGLAEADTLLVMAHDAVNRVLICRILGLPLARLWSFRQAPTTLNLLEGASVDALEVVRLNDCNHHTALFGEAVHRAL